MTKELITNRYGQTTPTHIQSNGCSISVPIYFSPTTEQLKTILNAFREVVRQQRLEMGWTDEAVTTNHGVKVVNNVPAPKTAIEEEMGMNEENLRYALFQRSGIPERLLIKLTKLCGIELVSREAIEQTYTQWLNYLYGDEEHGVKKPRKKSTTTKAKTTEDTN